MQFFLTIINLAVPPPPLKVSQRQPISLLHRRIDGYITYQLRRLGEKL